MSQPGDQPADINAIETAGDDWYPLSLAGAGPGFGSRQTALLTNF